MRTHDTAWSPNPVETIGLWDQLNDAIGQVKEQHLRLSAGLQRIYEEICAVRNATNEEAIAQAAQRLRTTVRLFKEQLDAHAAWEESELFPLAKWYFGNDMDVFTLLEQEHELAAHYFEAFLADADPLPRPIGHEEALRLTSYTLQAYALLKNHFNEEEEMLFAFADRSNGFGF